MGNNKLKHMQMGQNKEGLFQNHGNDSKGPSRL